MAPSSYYRYPSPSQILVALYFGTCPFGAQFQHFLWGSSCLCPSRIREVFAAQLCHYGQFFVPVNGIPAGCISVYLINVQVLDYPVPEDIQQF